MSLFHGRRLRSVPEYASNIGPMLLYFAEAVSAFGCLNRILNRLVWQDMG